MAKPTLDDQLAAEYAGLFASLVIRPERRDEVQRVADRVLRPANRKQYETVEAATSVPWFVVAIIHNLEADMAFSAHLHNGDPLTARTVNVPAGRPKKAPAGGGVYNWVESAIDALAYDGLDTWSTWTVPGIAYALERYNGFGYRTRFPFVKSPYLWGFSNVYTRGKFIRDGVFSPDAVSQQCGGMTLLSALMDEDDIAKRLLFQPPPDSDDVAKPTPFLPADGSVLEFPDNPPRFPGKYLMENTGDKVSVTRLQKRLADMGASPGAPTGTFDTPTKYAVQLFQARSVDLDGAPLEIDGIVGPMTWGALFGPLSIESEWVKPRVAIKKAERTLASAVLDVASDQIGVREIPPNSNCGREVEAFLGSVGLGRGNPWCMAFVYWCFAQAAQDLGVANRVPRSGHVRTAWKETSARTSGVRVVTGREARVDPSLVTPGMVFFLGLSGSTGHAGIVADNINGKLVTIEGNTNQDGVRDGGGVFRRVGRKVTDGTILGFAAFG
ncbi:peptidoglycan-binding protein [Xanthobacter autotrophicus]|jgi:lysozyme family protein|uniref:CHAP domain-containing protein n=1 Tax=Xanthobacter autotrophicus TaxID=280 RepID=A0A6C1KBI1_XANAU|nr:peptidoglycan-binding protein [Xanthobacter autotrophicus]TLX41151.1 CHAP domain-containing protein [Xanthobacter autotrophicus]